MNKDICAQFISIRKVLTLFFELPGILDSTLDYVNTVQKNSIIFRNIVQGCLYQEKTKDYKDKIILPLICAFDDYKNNNPLGSHKGVSKCGATYSSCPALHPDLQSKLENIFLFLLFNTKNRMEFINKIVFTKAKEELNYIQHNGISITVGNEKKQLYFALILISGDNLGLHSVLGYVESFSAILFCRFSLTGFQYGVNDHANKPISISEAHIKNVCLII